MNKPLDPSLLDTASVSDYGHWQALLNLEFANRSRGVRLVKNEHKGPLYVQKSFYPEGPDCAHAYLLHPPGGLVTGDTLSITIQASEQSHALITTPGAGRVYKARDLGGVQTQNLTLRVQENAILEWFPLENILFPSAHARMNTQVELAEGAKFIGWDVTCFGLPANKIPFENGSVNQTMQIWSEGKIRFNEALVIEPAVEPFLNGNAGLMGLPVHGLLVAGPFEHQEVELINALRLVQDDCAPNEFLASSQVGDFITVRYLGDCTERARKLFTKAWSLIRPAYIQKEAVEPRIWAT